MTHSWCAWNERCGASGCSRRTTSWTRAFATYAPDALLAQVGQPLLDRLKADHEEGALRFATSLLELRLLAHARGWDAGADRWSCWAARRAGNGRWS